MATTNTHWFTLFQKRHPIISNLLVSLIGIFIGYIGTYIFDINPSIKNINAYTAKILAKQDSSIAILKAVNDKYTINGAEGADIKVGYSGEANEDLIKVMKSDKLDLKRGDEIYLINYVGKFKPSVRVMVEEVMSAPSQNMKSDVMLYISKEAASRLGLEKELYKGVFMLKMKRIIK